MRSPAISPPPAAGSSPSPSSSTAIAPPAKPSFRPSTASPKPSPPPSKPFDRPHLDQFRAPSIPRSLRNGWEDKLSKVRIQRVRDRESYHQSEMRYPYFSSFLAIFACALGIAAALAGCRSLPPSKPESQWTTEEARGAVVYRQACVRCHYPTTTGSLHGPGLQAITKVQSMPSGAPPTDERLTAVIIHGRGMMPGTVLTDA